MKNDARATPEKSPILVCNDDDGDNGDGNGDDNGDGDNGDDNGDGDDGDNGNGDDGSDNKNVQKFFHLSPSFPFSAKAFTLGAGTLGTAA